LTKQETPGDAPWEERVELEEVRYDRQTKGTISFKGGDEGFYRGKRCLQKFIEEKDMGAGQLKKRKIRGAYPILQI